MSQVYSTEPSTTGRVVLQTTHGPIDINLWCKECPTATRTFLQLCLDGYYNDMPFHRIVNDFLIQSGDNKNRQSTSSSSSQPNSKEMDHKIQSYMNRYAPMGCWKSDISGDGSAGGGNAWLSRKKLELNPRIQFNHRGQIAMALPLDADLNGDNHDEESDKEAMSLARQFFITLDEAPFLTGKHVLFGTVSGDTIFNAIRMGKTEVEEGDLGRPLDMEHGPRIKSVKIAHHIFEDLVLTKEDEVPWKDLKNKENEGKELSEVKKRRKKRKGKKDLNVLSFGTEMEEEEGDFGDVGMISSHDIKKKNIAVDKEEKRDDKSVKKRKKKYDRKRLEEEHTSDKQKKNVNIEEASSSLQTPEILPLQSSLEKASKHMVESASESNAHSKEELEPTNKKSSKISAIELRRAKYLSKRQSQKRGSKSRDQDTMSRLFTFKSKVLNVKGIDENGNATNAGGNASSLPKDNSLAARMLKRSETNTQKTSKSFTSPTYSGQVLADDEKGTAAANDGSWLKTRFKCKRHIDHDSKDQSIGGDGRNINEYEVIDEKRKRKARGTDDRHHQREERSSKHRRR